MTPWQDLVLFSRLSRCACSDDLTSSFQTKVRTSLESLPDGIPSLSRPEAGIADAVLTTLTRLHEFELCHGLRASPLSGRSVDYDQI